MILLHKIIDVICHRFYRKRYKYKNCAFTFIYAGRNPRLYIDTVTFYNVQYAYTQVITFMEGRLTKQQHNR